MRAHAEGLERSKKAGLGTRLEVDEAATVLSTTLAQIDAIEDAIALQNHQLAALAGKGPGVGERIPRPAPKLEGPVRLPESLPAELLGHRPDVLVHLLVARSRVTLPVTCGRPITCRCRLR